MKKRLRKHYSSQNKRPILQRVEQNSDGTRLPLVNNEWLHFPGHVFGLIFHATYLPNVIILAQVWLWPPQPWWPKVAHLVPKVNHSDECRDERAPSRPAALTVKLCFFRKKVWCCPVSGSSFGVKGYILPLRSPKYPFTCIHRSSTSLQWPFISPLWRWRCNCVINYETEWWNVAFMIPQRIPCLCPTVPLSSLWLWNLTLKWIDLLSIILIHFFFKI